MRIPCSVEDAEGKRRKEELEECIVSRLTKRIMMARKRHRLMMDAQAAELEKDEAECDTQDQLIMLYPPVDGSAWVGISSPNYGRRFYVRLKKGISVTCNAAPNRLRQLNSRPIQSILSTARVSCDSCGTACDDSDSDNNIETYKSKRDWLWVDKYAPRNFADLISNDKINRMLLIWMKLWDECVFKRRVPQLVTGDENKLEDMLTLDEGRPRRPLQKVVLISGSAGVGKTTLANVIARHAGYRAVEMNASGDRNVADFDKCIEGALRAVKTLDADRRPVCLIIDEIDGAPVDAVRHLCKLVSKTGRKAIWRPVICICNNLYTPQLRDLRAIALILQVPSVDQQRLEKRLQEIAEREHVRADEGAIAAIVSACSLDLRSSINALQFLAAESPSCTVDSTTAAKYSENEGLYGDKSLFDMWACILDLQRHLNVRGTVESLEHRVQRITSLCQRCAADGDRFYTGLFANYLNSVCGSNRVSPACIAARQFCEYDLIMSCITHSRNYSLMKYTLAVSVLIHLLLASANRIQLTFPTAEQNAGQKKRQSLEVVKSIRSSALQRDLTERTLLLDLLPFLVVVVQPPLKPMNAQLYSGREVDLLRSVVAVMRSYSLTFKPSFQDGATSYLFYPPVEVLVCFPLEENDGCSALFSNNVRQMIAHQIELNRIGSDMCLQEKVKKSRKLTSIVASENGEATSTMRYECMGQTDSHITFRYNQGFSNAIRKCIRMQNLIF